MLWFIALHYYTVITVVLQYYVLSVHEVANVNVWKRA